MIHGRRVALENRSRAVFALSYDGRRWVLKRKITPQGVLAEALAWLLCQAMGMCIPHAAAVRPPRRPSARQPEWIWASQYVELLGWNEAVRENVGDTSRFAGLMVLDAWLGNEDRHRDNLVLLQTPNLNRVEFLALDFDAAWVGSEIMRLPDWSAVPTPALLPSPPVAELWRAAVPAWVARARGIPHNDLLQFVREACQLANIPREQPLLTWLSRRRDHLDPIVDTMSTTLLEGVT